MQLLRPAVRRFPKKPHTQGPESGKSTSGSVPGRTESRDPSPVVPAAQFTAANLWMEPACPVWVSGRAKRPVHSQARSQPPEAALPAPATSRADPEDVMRSEEDRPEGSTDTGALEEGDAQGKRRRCPGPGCVEWPEQIRTAESRDGGTRWGHNWCHRAAHWKWLRSLHFHTQLNAEMKNKSSTGSTATPFCYPQTLSKNSGCPCWAAVEVGEGPGLRVGRPAPPHR